MQRGHYQDKISLVVVTTVQYDFLIDKIIENGTIIM